jgi:hypothetical protein
MIATPQKINRNTKKNCPNVHEKFTTGDNLMHSNLQATPPTQMEANTGC